LAQIRVEPKPPVRWPYWLMAALLIMVAAWMFYERSIATATDNYQRDSVSTTATPPPVRDTVTPPPRP
jgi:hypothetical protein